eukprot:TRINITY_DN12699_c0_g1_i1.p1 TRINITY_DN12699_c0_g1~~TRINITY_DN12699_c0_g1_i1.p1  ORF type:complete len:358 (+),score=50.42 TRINITY_DN12699_c0_g1_i1:29-1075(+)
MAAFVVTGTQPFRAIDAQPTSLVSYAEHSRYGARTRAEPATSTHLVSNLAAGFAVGLGARTWRGLRRRASGGVTMVQSPPETFNSLVAKGEANAKMSVLKTFHASYMVGCYVGMSGLLSLVIAGNLAPGNMTAQVVIFASLFPINLLLVLQSGGQLFTGNTASMSMAYYEGKTTLDQVGRNWLISYVGNISGCVMMALIAKYIGLLTSGAADLAIRVAVKKCSASFGVTLVKGMMCNWLVCMAVWLATSAQDLTGKMVGIWFPISMFIMIGFEHSVANLFMLPAGLLSGAPLSVSDIIFKNLVPITIGNAITGAIIIGAGFSFSLGKLGGGSAGSFRGIAKKLFSRTE